MKLKIVFFLIFIVLLSSGLSVQAQEAEKCLSISQESINQFESGQHDAIYAHFDDMMRSKLSKAEMSQIWSQLEMAMGKFVESGEPKGMSFESYYQVETQLRFEKKNLRYRLSFDKNNRITGMYFVPYRQAREPYKSFSNEYLKEVPIKVHSSGIDLPGTLCLPKGVKSFPLVVFVHGSGANDRDETIGPNKPFRDLAHGLAKMGIASIRYDKRSLVNPGSLKELNGQSMLDVLVVNDALAAVALGRTIKGVQQKSVFVLGHSLGAIMAPRIAQRDINIKGIIMMAGNARPLEDLVYDQYKYIYNRDGLSKAEKQDLKKIQKKVHHVKHLERYISHTEDISLPLTNDVRFWKSVNNYNQIKTAQEIPQSILIMQGMRDYQVTPREYKIWQHKLHSKKNTSFKSYDKLNHLFLEGKGNSYPEEYERQGNIPQYVVSDIAAWIKTIQ